MEFAIKGVEQVVAAIFQRQLPAEFPRSGRIGK
jgi:hypothetical protein